MRDYRISEYFFEKSRDWGGAELSSTPVYVVERRRRRMFGILSDAWVPVSFKGAREIRIGNKEMGYVSGLYVLDEYWARFNSRDAAEALVSVITNPETGFVFSRDDTKKTIMRSWFALTADGFMEVYYFPRLRKFEWYENNERDVVSITKNKAFYGFRTKDSAVNWAVGELSSQ